LLVPPFRPWRILAWIAILTLIGLVLNWLVTTPLIGLVESRLLHDGELSRENTMRAHLLTIAFVIYAGLWLQCWRQPMRNLRSKMVLSLFWLAFAGLFGVLLADPVARKSRPCVC
jgi:asparagine N-glycosylation enzyme membrane subunit Stt3